MKARGGYDIFGPETPVPDDVEVDLKIVYDARAYSSSGLASSLRLLADHIADDPEFDAADARHALTNPRFATGVYHPSSEQRMRMIAEVYPADGNAPSKARVDELKARLGDLPPEESWPSDPDEPDVPF
jgi:hypothetical protein